MKHNAESASVQSQLELLRDTCRELVSQAQNNHFNFWSNTKLTALKAFLALCREGSASQHVLCTAQNINKCRAAVLYISQSTPAILMTPSLLERLNMVVALSFEPDALQEWVVQQLSPYWNLLNAGMDIPAWLEAALLVAMYIRGDESQNDIWLSLAQLVCHTTDANYVGNTDTTWVEQWGDANKRFAEDIKQELDFGYNTTKSKRS